MIAAVLCVTSALVPTDRVHISHSQSRATSFIYLASFVMHLGAQIWMTFVSGNCNKRNGIEKDNRIDEKL